MTPTSWWPTRKVIAGTVTGIIGVLTMWATTGAWDVEETVGALTVAGQFTLAWLTPNNPDNPAS